MNALMIDIETLSLKPTAFVTQVGYCVANLNTREYLVQPTNIWINDTQSDCDLDLETIRWWMNQSDAARKAVFGPSNRVPPRVAHDTLGRIVQEFQPTIWGSPAMFDLPILTHMWGGKKPWAYNMERDMMTLYKMLDPTGALKPPANNLAHDAASDASWQMEYLFNLYDNLKELQA